MKELLIVLYLAIAVVDGFRNMKSMNPAGSTLALVGRRSNSLPFATFEPPTELPVKPKQDKSQFQWFKQWYPVVPVEILDLEKPSKFTLLGMDLVIWNDGKVGPFQSKKKRPKKAKRTMGEWRAFEDVCPHRKVPLSEGRVEDDGTLLCSYHGWRFDGSGACTAIPQLTDADKIMQNPKSSCNAFPTMIQNGILWVWPSNDHDAVLESAVSPPNTSAADKDDPDALWVGPWGYRELPYGADFFIENVVDPAHVAVSHHGVAGDRYADQTMINTLIEPLNENGFKFQADSPKTDLKPSTFEFKAPGLVDIVSPFGDEGSYQNLQLYVSPSRPGFCNHVGRMVIRKDSNGKFPEFLRVFTLPIPAWFNHVVLASAFLNQDGLFLHHQERTLAHTNQYKAYEETEDGVAYNFNKAILPVESDVGVVNFRNWLRLLAGGKIPYKYNPTMPAPSSDVVFDVWNGHTKHCKYCLDARRRLKKLRSASFLASAALAIVRPSRLGVFGNLLASFGLAGVGVMLHKLIGMFHRYEFSHSENN